MLAFDGYGDTADFAGLVRPSSQVVAAPSGSGTLTGTYYAYVSYVRRDGFESSLSDVSAPFTLTNAEEVSYSSVPVSPDIRVVKRRIYRTTAQQQRTVYLDVEIDNNSATTAASDLTDSILAVQLAYPLLTDKNQSTTLNHEPPPNDKPFLAWHNQRGYGAGFQEYAEGSIEVTLGSNTVQGRGTEWKETFATRLLYIDGGDATYEIDSVDEDNQTITLLNPYLGVTNLFAAYAIRPFPTACNTVPYTLPDDAESWPPENAFTIPEDGDIITGLMPMGSFLYILKRRSIYRFTVQKDPLTDGETWLGTKRGCINHRCFVVIGDSSLLLDERGIHSFNGQQESNDASSPVQDIFRDGGGNIPINWNASHFFHAVHSLSEQTVRWFVAFRGHYLPRHALAYNYVTNNWWIEYYPRAVGASAVGNSGRAANTWSPSGGDRIYLGSDSNAFFALQENAPDVFAEKTARVYGVVSAGIETVTVSGLLPNAGAGMPVVVRNGRGRLQTRRITSVSGTTITVTPPWLIQPESGDKIQLGGFGYQVVTQGLRFAGGEVTSERNAEIGFRPVAGQQIDISWRHDYQAELQECSASIRPSENFGVANIKGQESREVDTTKLDGASLIQFNSLRENQTDGPRHVQITMEGVGGAGRQSITQVILKGIVS
jgi:hypothetical protein